MTTVFFLTFTSDYPAQHPVINFELRLVLNANFLTLNKLVSIYVECLKLQSIDLWKGNCFS